MSPTYLSQHFHHLSYEKYNDQEINNTIHSDQVENFRSYRDVNHDQAMQQELKDHHFVIGESAAITEDQNSSDQHSGDHCSGKWMPSKMRWMTKMMASSKTAANKPRKSLQVTADHKHEKINGSSSSDSAGGIIRVCSDCNTTKTPLWRSGPQGPKSLCNACGIRQRKARRAMAMAAAGVSGGLIPADQDRPNKVAKVKISERSVLPFKKRCTLPFKKRCKMISAATGNNSQQKLQFDDVIISLSNKSSSYKVFPQDEREGAILLMALSYGLIRS